MTNMLSETRASFSDIQNELYRSLPKSPLTASMLSVELSPYFPNKTIAELENDCLRMLDGIRSGMDDCDHAERMEESDIDQEIKDRLQAALEDKSEEEQKQYLIQLFNIFYNKSGNNITPELAIYIAGMKTSELLDEVVFLIHQEGVISGVHLVNTIEHYSDQANHHIEHIKTYAEDFTAEDHMWIAAASMYAAGIQEDDPVTDPETIGHQVGFLGRFVQTIGRLAKRYVVPVLSGFVCCAGCYMLINFGVDWIFAGEKALASLSFFSAESILPMIITDVVGYLGLSVACLLLLAGISLSIVYLMSNAYEDLDAHTNSLTEKATKLSLPIIAAPEAPVSVQGHVLQPGYQTVSAKQEDVYST